MKPVQMYNKMVISLTRLSNITLLLIRLVLAYGFFVTARMKIGNVEGIASWFASMNYPFPLLSAYMATITEVVGVFLLALGLGSRLIVMPLIFVMLVAIVTVHWGNGFNAGDNGSEIPIYYLLMLFVLLVYGSGRFSLDHLISAKQK
jgi:putative oxidoreductase